GSEGDDLRDPRGRPDPQRMGIEEAARRLAGRSRLSRSEIRTAPRGDAQSRSHSVAVVVYIAQIDDTEHVEALEGDPVGHFRHGHRLDARALCPALDQAVDP